jgi:exosortase H (IPTLxxWG-CTERM-specific)
MLRRYSPALIFLATMVAGGILLLNPRLQERELLSLSIVITQLSSGALDALGFSVARDARTLFVPGGSFGMRVDNDCNGAWAHLIFLASLLAYPTTWKEKLVGLAVGQPLLFLLNVLCVMSLFAIGVYAPAIFRATHVYVWQFLIIGLALLLFFIWVDKFVRRPA